jgi:hypothetical protein
MTSPTLGEIPTSISVPSEQTSPLPNLSLVVDTTIIDAQVRKRKNEGEYVQQPYVRKPYISMTP